MLELRAIKGPTGRLLAEMLKERGLLGGRIKGVVNYGYGGEAHNLPTLNANAGRQNKYQELVELDNAGVRTVPFSLDVDVLDPPVLGRKFHHTQGRDIIFCNGHRQSFRDYYTQLIPKRHEFRVWVFRNKVLAVYHKVLDYPERNGRGGRSKEIWNWKNGYAFHFVPNGTEPGGLRDAAVAAVEALELDFGGVDMIYGQDRKFYVLEVNTAPGTQGEPRQGMTSLVNCIERWVKNGFKNRE